MGLGWGGGCVAGRWLRWLRLPLGGGGHCDCDSVCVCVCVGSLVVFERVVCIFIAVVGSCKWMLSGVEEEGFPGSASF